MKSFLQNNIIDMYSRDDEGISFLLKDLLEPERIKFINT